VWYAENLLVAAVGVPIASISWIDSARIESLNIEPQSEERRSFPLPSA